MIITLAHLDIQPTQELAFLEEIRSLIEASQNEQGNHSYTLKKDIDKDHHYTMIEIWEDMDAVGRHNASAHFKAFAAKAPTFLAAPLSVQLFEGSEVKI
ncbi:quinol monooxygenase YgiN [Bacillus ectoiniformans]|uniref:putative quinol monooxygenase n=1 Tax=Bacillus ectoiniformans TaxID=1494429 RepID=UPI00195A060E|nr:putative quinol monooxygenase [Bacillus ectoiniformans]MBM7649471.1 quinol monooxygenase YgiN [Bacillus ectoiniformans]